MAYKRTMIILTIILAVLATGYWTGLFEHLGILNYMTLGF